MFKLGTLYYRLPILTVLLLAGVLTIRSLPVAAQSLCSSPTVITGGGSYGVSTSGTCFKYVNTTFVNGGMFSVMKDATSTSDTLQWYGGLDQNATACATQSSTI